MFRDTSKSPMSPQNFGVGSIIDAYGSGKFLVVADQVDDVVYLVRLKDMMALPGQIGVMDINHLSESEARELVELTQLNYTFSDFTLDSKGIKNV